MTIKTRLNALELRAPDGLSRSARAWLGQELTPAEDDMARIEAARGFSVNVNMMSKGAQAWLAA